MSEATVTALPTGPVGVVHDHACDECDRTFASPNGLAIHRGRSHGTDAEAPAPTRTRVPAKPAKSPPRAAVPVVVDVSERQALAGLASAYADLCGADVETSIESAAALLDAMTGRGWRLVEA